MCSDSPKISLSGLLHSLIILEILNCTHGIQKYYALEPYLQCPTIICAEAPALLHQPQECDSPPNQYD